MGADLSITTDDGDLPTHMAAQVGHHECLQALIDAGANVNVPDGGGNTPIHTALSNGHDECVRILIACKRTDLSLRNKVHLRARPHTFM